MINHKKSSYRIVFGLWTALALAFLTVLAVPSQASAQGGTSGERIVHQGAAESALNGQTGNTVFQMVPAHAPLPTHTNEAAQTRLYFVMYPLSSDVPANSLNCQPDNCDHLNVLPFPNANYDPLPGSNTACMDFNQGQPCSQVKGHDHLRAGSPPRGESSSIWSEWIVTFTDKGIKDGAYNNRITTLNQLYSLKTCGDVTWVGPVGSVTLTPVPKRLYQMGTPLEVNYP